MVVRYDSFKPASILRKVCHQRLESHTIHALAEGREDRYDESPFITASGELIDKALDQLKCLVIGGLAIVGFTCVNLNYRCRTPKLRELQFLDCYSPPELINREGAIQAAIYCQRLCRLNKASLRVLNLSGMHHFLAIHGYHWTWISQLCQFHKLRHLTLGTHRRAFFLAPNVASAIWNIPALERLDFHYDTQPEDAGQWLPTYSESDFVLTSLEVAMPGRHIRTSIRIISIMCEHRNMPISSMLFKDNSKEHRRRMQRWLKSIKAKYLERGILLEA